MLRSLEGSGSLPSPRRREPWRRPTRRKERTVFEMQAKTLANRAAIDGRRAAFHLRPRSPAFDHASAMESSRPAIKAP